MTEPPEPPEPPASPEPPQPPPARDRGRSPELLNELFRDALDPGYTDAAARRAAAGTTPDSPGTGGGGGTGVVRWRFGVRAVSLLVLAAIGLTFAVAYRQVVAEEPTRDQVRADLEDQIHDRQGVTDRLQDRAEGLRDDVARLRDRQLGDPAEAERLRQLEAATGLARVQGDGIVVRVADGQVGVDEGTGAAAVESPARILDVDLQLITNALWAAGAEAIAVNDRRLGPTSTIRGASGAILVDRVPVAGPYDVVAIGPDELSQRFAGSLAARLMEGLVQQHGATYEVEAGHDLMLPAAATPELDYATPVGGD